MSTTIAISGKGGSGKTTIASIFIRLLAARGNGPVLAVDADPNSCLGLTLGVQPTTTVAQLREQARQKQPKAEGMDKIRSFEFGLQQTITEAHHFDLLTMGRPEGPNCYCAVNNLLRQFLDRLTAAYSFVVIDNEAGMEHLSRRTTNNVDLLCIVAEPTPLGSLTAKRICDLARELPVSIKKIGIIWNHTLPTANRRLTIENSKSKIENIDTLGSVPFDQTVFDASMNLKTVFDYQENGLALSSVKKILENILNLKGPSVTQSYFL